MLDRQGGEIVIECDKCDAVLDTGTKDFDEARAAMRQAGWVSQKLGKDWLHFCDKCGYDDPRQAAMRL